MRILITRPEPDASVLKAKLEALGHEVIVEPMLRIDFADCDPVCLANVQALIATSRNALRALDKTINTRASAELLEMARALPLFTVGRGTAALARKMGFSRLHCGPGKAASLPPMIASTLPPEDGRLLQLAGADLAVDLTAMLGAAGFGFARTTVYRAKARETLSKSLTALLRQGKIDSVLLMSPRTATIYASLVTSEQLIDETTEMTHFCLSEQVSKGLSMLGKPQVEIAQTPNTEEMLALLADSIAKRR